MVIAVLSERFFASSISVIIVNFCFLLKYLWRLLGAFFFCCMLLYDVAQENTSQLKKIEYKSVLHNLYRDTYSKRIFFRWVPPS